MMMENDSMAWLPDTDPTLPRLLPQQAAPDEGRVVGCFLFRRFQIIKE